MDFLKAWDNETAFVIARRVAWVAGGLAALVAVLLLADYRRRLVKDPLENPTFLTLRTQLAQQPRDAELKAKIRQADLELRREYFRQRTFAGTGGVLLVVASIVALLAARTALTLRRKLPTPALQATAVDREVAAAPAARRSVAAMGGALAAAAIVLVLTTRTPLARSDVDLVAAAAASPPATDGEKAAAPVPTVADTPKTTEVAAADPAGKESAPAPSPLTPGPSPAKGEGSATGDVPSDDEVAQNWPRFRGPLGSGIVKEGKYPTSWNAEEDQNIVWKTPLALPGNGSPVLWGPRLFLASATPTARKIFCFDTASGKQLWATDIPATPQAGAAPPKVMEDTGFAASSMATDGRRAYAVFATGDVAAVDFAGKIVWTRGFGVPHNEYGHASSLVCHKGKLLVQIDQGSAKDKLSKLYALDPATGKNVWEVPRPAPASWTTPLAATIAGREQIVTAGDPFVISYNPADGSELWRARCLRQDVGPSPTAAGGLVFVASEFPALSAIRADGQGDVTATHVAWKGEDGLPDTCSPLATDEFVVLVATPGEVTCYDTKTGKKLWEKEFDSQFKASPSLAGKLLYLVGDEGKSWVVELGAKEPKEVGTGELGENCVASPVFHENRIYLRAQKHLYCLGAK